MHKHVYAQVGVRVFLCVCECLIVLCFDMSCHVIVSYFMECNSIRCYVMLMPTLVSNKIYRSVKSAPDFPGQGGPAGWACGG